MSEGITLVLFEHKGRTIAVNPARVAFVETGNGSPDYTCIRFSGLEGDYAYVSGHVDEVIARLSQPASPVA